MKNGFSVLIVDDSSFYRKILNEIISSLPIVASVDLAANGFEAIEKIKDNDYDLITLDVLMPKMNGLEALSSIKNIKPDIPVLMVSSFTTHSANFTIKALQLGAVDFITKPASKNNDFNSKLLKRDIQNKILGALYNRIFDLPTHLQTDAKTMSRGESNYDLICIGASTGGMATITNILSNFKHRHIHVPVVIVQHIPQYFLEPFYNHIKNTTSVNFVIARHNMLLENYKVYLAPAKSHLRIIKREDSYYCNLDFLSDNVSGFKPSIDVLLYSQAIASGKSSIAVLLSGMGLDGVRGAGAVRRAGGLTIAQSPESSKVPGIITAALHAKAIERIVPLGSIPSVLEKEIADSH